MGALIGGIVGGVGALIGGNKQAKAANAATQASLSGYNYLTSGGGAPLTQAQTTAGTAATNAQAALLGIGGNPAQAQAAFNNYLGSTGYQFQLGQGMNAITSNAASRGLLNSGGTIRAAQKYGQNLASGYFNNYLGQLGGMAQQGSNAAGLVAGIGTNAGANAGRSIMAGGNAQSTALNNALGSFTGAFNSMPNLNAKLSGMGLW